MELCVRFFFSVFVVVTIHLVGSGKSASVSCRNIDYGLINRNERKTSGLFERLIMIVCVYVETHKKPNLNRYFFTSLLKLGLVFFSLLDRLRYAFLRVCLCYFNSVSYNAYTKWIAYFFLYQNRIPAPFCIHIYYISMQCTENGIKIFRRVAFPYPHLYTRTYTQTHLQLSRIYTTIRRNE